MSASGQIAPEEVRGAALPETQRRPKLAFAGVGWIGLNRLEAIADSGFAEIVAVADISAELARRAGERCPGAQVASSLEELLASDAEGIVIATPSGLHAEQSITALEAGRSVFCQKPLARTAEECRRIVAAAERRNRLLGVDFSYRHTAAMAAVRQLVTSGAIGEVFAVDLVFHNAWGPDKPWFYDPKHSGGGCVIDLGIHLVDLALWTLGFPVVDEVNSQFRRSSGGVEDYAVAQLRFAGVSARLACSWNLNAGRDAVIEANFYGTSGGASFRNVNGSFYDFVAERFHKTSRERLVEPPDSWSGRAAVNWVRRLAASPAFDPAAHEFVAVAEVIDRIYEAAR
jgi:predicted dehydrogenase